MIFVLRLETDSIELERITPQHRRGVRIMPNWCSNRLTITGDTDTLVQLKEVIESDGDGLLEAIKPNVEWGTKWDVSTEGLELEYIDNGDGTSTIEGCFESAWSAPIEAMHTLSQDWDSCYIQLMYEEGNEQFVGCWDSEGVDDCYDYGDFTSKNIKDNIPEYLVEEFALDEQLELCEEEDIREERDYLIGLNNDFQNLDLSEELTTLFTPSQP